MIDFDPDSDEPMPQYLPREEKDGETGEMILSLTVNARGQVKKVRVVKSLSPRLDKVAMKTFRKWTFKLRDGNSHSLPDDFQLHVFYKAMCSPFL